MGLCCRAAGAGKRVLIYQFMKDGQGNERAVLEKLPDICFANEPRIVSFSFKMNDAEKAAEKTYYEREFAQVTDRARRDSFDILFLDEILYAINSELLDESLLIRFLDHKPEGLEVILTGRDPSDALRKRADYISEIRKEKHPYDRGLAAREGIER